MIPSYSRGFFLSSLETYIMKRLLLLTLFLGTFFTVEAQETTYYLVRHAEKDRSNPDDHNPHLTKEGRLRAIKWKEVLSNVDLDAVYSTEYHRTIETAKPTARNQELAILFYNPKDQYNDAFKEATDGKKVLIVGHSNTTPFFVNKIIGEEVYEQIEDDNNANLYIISIKNGEISHQLLKVN